MSPLWSGPPTSYHQLPGTCTILVVHFLQQLVIHCERENCRKLVYLGELRTHLDSGCKKNSEVKQAITLDQISNQPTHAPPTQVEIATAGVVVRKIMSSQPPGQQHFSLPTGGCVSCWLPIIHAYIIIMTFNPNNSQSHSPKWPSPPLAPVRPARRHSVDEQMNWTSTEV